MNRTDRVTPEIAEKIEAVLAYAEERGHRATMIEFNITGLPQLSGFISVMRSLGIVVGSRKSARMSPQDSKDFIEFLRAKKAAEDQRR